MASAGESFIGCLISLVSKYEIRYEGVLYQLDVNDSTIGLKNVRSFGTEGRKKDGPQVPPSDKVYEFILFRGSDIKDLQVKSSPPAKAEEQIPTDPAIIQSQGSDESFQSPLIASSGMNNLTESAQWNDTPALRTTGHSATLSSYNSATQMGSEFSSMPPTTMYNQGYTGKFVGSLNPQHQIGVQPSPILPNPLGSASSSEIRTPASSAPLSSVNPNFSPSVSSMQYPSPPNMALSSFSGTSQRPYSVPFTGNMPTMTTMPQSHQDLAVNQTQIAQKTVSDQASLPSGFANTPIMPTFPLSHQDLNTNEAQVVQTTVSDSAQVMPSLVRPNLGPFLAPSQSLIRPNYSPNLGTQIHPSAQNLYVNQNQRNPDSSFNSVPMPSNYSSPMPTLRGQAPLLPMPAPVQKFTEEFDFEAMNEKFNKDEVWGYLGKAKQADNGNRDVDTAGQSSEEKEGHGSENNAKTAYNKDDFFDSISCNSLGHGPRRPQNQYSDRRPDNNGYGYQQRPNPGYGGGYGGYGDGRGGNFRGPPNWGRGYGNYGGRGRGGNFQY